VHAINICLPIFSRDIHGHFSMLPMAITVTKIGTSVCHACIDCNPEPSSLGQTSLPPCVPLFRNITRLQWPLICTHVRAAAAGKSSSLHACRFFGGSETCITSAIEASSRPWATRSVAGFYSRASGYPRRSSRARPHKMQQG
jgi:hypothetical protein